MFSLYTKSSRHFLPYTVMNRRDWSDLQKVKVRITRTSRLDAVLRTWAADDDDLWHPTPSNGLAIGGTMATPRQTPNETI